MTEPDQKQDKSAASREYVALLEYYIRKNFEPRGIVVYAEVPMGMSIIGKKRKLDLLLIETESKVALGIECKFQAAAGTTDEKIPYAIQDVTQMHLASRVVYGGGGWSGGILHMLEASSYAAYCLPDPNNPVPISARQRQQRPYSTWEFDHILAATFGWWDLVEKNSRPPLTVAPIFPNLRRALEEHELKSALRAGRRPPKSAKPKPKEPIPEVPRASGSTEE